MAWADRNKAALFCLATSIFILAFAGFLRMQPESDLTTHLGYAERMNSISDIESPHFLLQILLKVLMAIGLSPVVAMALLLGLCYGGMAILIARELERRGIALTAARAFLIVPAVLIASHIFLFTLTRHNLYFGYFVPIVYHNPTQQLGKLFALWIWFRFCAQFIERSQHSWRQVALTGMLCILSAVAKPSFLIAFLPVGVCVGMVAVVRGAWRSAFQLAFGIGLPSVAILLWQARFAYGADLSSEVIFAPFAVFNAGQTLYKLPASLAFPLIVAALAWRAHELNAKLGWAQVFTGIALLQTLLLAEAGNVGAGNFAWTGQTGVFLLYVESVLFLLGRVWPCGWRLVGWSVFAVHVICGVIWYAASFFPERPSFL